MPFLAGLLSGFQQRSAEVGQQRDQEEAANKDREGKIFEALVNSPDADVQSHAIAGLLDSAASKRPTGFLNAMTKAHTSPYLPIIQRIIGQKTAASQQAPSGASAAQGEVGPTAAGAPPLSMAAAGTPGGPAPADSATPTPPSPPVRPYRVFPTAVDTAGDTAAAQAAGTLRGQAAAWSALSPEQQQGMLKMRGGIGMVTPRAPIQIMGSAAPPGTLDTAQQPLDPNKTYTREEIGYGNYQYTQSVPKGAAAGSIRVAAKDDGSGNALYRINPDNTSTWIRDIAAGEKTVTIEHDDGSRETLFVPVPMQRTTGAPAGTPPRPPTGAAQTPAGAPPSRAGTSAPASAPPPRAGGIQTRGAQYKNVTVMFPDGTFGSALEGKTGQVVDATTKQPITGAVEVPKGAPLPKALSTQGRQTLMGANMLQDTAQHLIQQIEANGEATDNNPVSQHIDQWFYNHGLDPGDAQRQLFQETGVGDAYGLKALLGGRPNAQLIEIFQSHLFKVGDSPQLIYGKAKELLNIADQIKKNVMTVENTRTAPQLRGGGPGPGAAGSPGSAPTVGEERTIGGVQRVFDGHGWRLKGQ